MNTQHSLSVGSTAQAATYINAFDYLRGAAILCVVFMHTTLENVYRPIDILVGSFLHNLFIVGVPIFFFISGYLVSNDKSSSFWVFIKKKIERVYVPALAWTTFFWILLSMLGTVKNLEIVELYNRILFLSEPGQYYYIFVLMLLFCVSFHFKNAHETMLKNILIISLVVNSITVICYEAAIWAVDPKKLPGIAMYRNPTAWSFFFFYGLYIARVDRNFRGTWFLQLQQKSFFWASLLVFLWVCTSIETWLLFSKNAPGGQDYFKITGFCYEFLALNYALVIAHKLRDCQRLAGLLKLLGKFAFFIFLVHLPTVPKLLALVHLDLLASTHYYLYMIIRSMLCIILPIALAYTLKIVVPMGSFRQHISWALGAPHT